MGVRGLDSTIDVSREHEESISYISASNARMPSALDSISNFCEDRQVYLTVDIDVLDPSFAPEVVYPSMGGLAPHELGAIVRRVFQAGAVIGMDVVEACPASWGRSMAAMRAVDLVRDVLIAEGGVLPKEMDAP